MGWSYRKVKNRTKMVGEINVEGFKELCFSLRQVYIGQQTENCEVRILKSLFIAIDASDLNKISTQ